MSLPIDTNSILQNLDKYSPQQKKELLDLLSEYEEAKTKLRKKIIFIHRDRTS